VVVSNAYCIAFLFVCFVLVYFAFLDCPFWIAPSVFSSVY
jgi:hypothetical protein